MKLQLKIMLICAPLLFGSFDSLALTCTSLLKKAETSPFERLIEFSLGDDLSGIGLDSLLNPSDEFLRYHIENKDSYALNRSLVRTEPRDQCSVGSCWINAPLTALEWISPTLMGQHIKLSDMYLFKKHLAREGEKVFTGSKTAKTEHIEQGNFPYDAWMLARHNGLVPESVFEPKIDFRKNPTAVKRFMTAYRLFLKNLSERGGSIDFQISRLNAWLDHTIGEDPKNFELNGQTYTPKDLYNKLNYSNRLLRFDEDTDEAALKIIENLKKGAPTIASLDWIPEFIDPNHGIASIKAFSVDYKNNFNLQAYTESENGHVVMIVDYQVDENGRLVKFLAQNSHGTKVGDDGFYHIYADYFKAFFTEALVIEAQNTALP